jgi:hypothetical protein
MQLSIYKAKTQKLVLDYGKENDLDVSTFRDWAYVCVRKTLVF